MATPCDFCGGTTRKHAGGCPFGPTDAPRADPGNKHKGHRHDYKPNGTREGPVTRERRGLRWVKVRTTYYFEHCGVPDCPQPDRTTTSTRDV
jgi:hypothetical protein